MKETIYVNGSILNEQPTGLGIYALNIIKKLKVLCGDVKIFSPVDIENIDVIKITKKVKPNYGKKGGLYRFLWTQIVLPFKTKRNEYLYHPFQYLSFFSRSNQIITIHDFIPLYYPEVAKHQYYYYKYIMPILLKRAYKIICISQNTKEDLLKFYKVDENKVKVVYNGYDEELFNVNNIHEDVLKKYNIDYNYFVMVGASYPHKNLEAAINAFKLMKDRNQCKMVIVGKVSPRYMEKLKKCVDELNLNSEVVFLGYVEDSDLPSLYGFSKAFVYPTLYEGFGFPILEASACGTAVLCSDNSSLGEIAGNGAVYFGAHDINKISEAMSSILKDESFRNEIINSGYENLKRFSWQKAAEEIIKFISEK